MHVTVLALPGFTIIQDGATTDMIPIYVSIVILACVLLFIIPIILLRGSKKSRSQDMADLKETLNVVRDVWEKTSPEKKARIEDAVHTNLQRILTVPGCVVTYEPDALHGLVNRFLDPDKIDRKLTEILTANPHAELRQYEKVLGIKIINVERKDASSAGQIWT